MDVENNNSEHLQFQCLISFNNLVVMTSLVPRFYRFYDFSSISVICKVACFNRSLNETFLIKNSHKFEYTKTKKSLLLRFAQPTNDFLQKFQLLELRNTFLYRTNFWKSM